MSAGKADPGALRSCRRVYVAWLPQLVKLAARLPRRMAGDSDICSAHVRCRIGPIAFVPRNLRRIRQGCRMISEVRNLVAIFDG